MQFDVDLNSPLAELFLEVRAFIMSEIGDGVKEKLSNNITSYFNKEGGFCYLRTKNDYLHVGWFRGVNIDDRYRFLSGNGKVIRAHKIRIFDDTQKEAVRYYIGVTKLFLIEHNELMKMKKRKR